MRPSPVTLVIVALTCVAMASLLGIILLAYAGRPTSEALVSSLSACSGALAALLSKTTTPTKDTPPDA